MIPIVLEKRLLEYEGRGRGLRIVVLDGSVLLDCMN